MTWNDRRKGWLGRKEQDGSLERRFLISIEYRTVQETALILHRTPRTIRRWLSERTVFPKAKKVRDGWLIPITDIEHVFEDPDPLPHD